GDRLLLDRGGGGEPQRVDGAAERLGQVQGVETVPGRGGRLCGSGGSVGTLRIGSVGGRGKVGHDVLQRWGKSARAGGRAEAVRGRGVRLWGAGGSGGALRIGSVGGRGKVGHDVLQRWGKSARAGRRAGSVQETTGTEREQTRKAAGRTGTQSTVAVPPPTGPRWRDRSPCAVGWAVGASRAPYRPSAPT